MPSHGLALFKERQRDERQKLRAAAWGMRLAGSTYEQIGEALGTSKQTAHKLVKESFLDRDSEMANLVVAQMIDQLQAAMRIVCSVLVEAASAQDWDTQLKCVDRIIKISESRRALEGLNADRRERAPEEDQAEEDLSLLIKDAMRAARAEDLKAERDM